MIVLDTPPSRNALDFLDAPDRLLGFLEGRALQVFLAPGGLTARLFGRGTALVFAIFARVTGVDMLGELSRFFRSLVGRARRLRRAHARRRDAAALAPQTAFLIVTSPEAEPAQEAGFVAERLAQAGMTLGELIVNRVHRDGLDGHSVEDVAGLLDERPRPGARREVAGNLGRLRRARASRPRHDRAARHDARQARADPRAAPR